MGDFFPGASQIDFKPESKASPNFFHVLTHFFLAFETKLLLRPNIGASRDAPDAPSHTSMRAHIETG